MSRSASLKFVSLAGAILLAGAVAAPSTAAQDGTAAKRDKRAPASSDTATSQTAAPQGAVPGSDAAVSSVGALAGGAGGGAAAASYAATGRVVPPTNLGSTGAGAPDLLERHDSQGSVSLQTDAAASKVTKPKQTQGATFGEKVNAGLHAAGSALSQGASRPAEPARPTSASQKGK